MTVVVDLHDIGVVVGANGKCQLALLPLMKTWLPSKYKSGQCNDWGLCG